MYTIRNFFPNFQKKKQEQYIYFKTKGNFHICYIPEFPFFKPQDFLFILEKTFANYRGKIKKLGNIYQIKIPKESHSKGEIMAHFYFFVYNHWPYY
jgi:hypothetical protein